jgi:hypothetical protein
MINAKENNGESGKKQEKRKGKNQFSAPFNEE